MITTWLTENYLSKMNELEDLASTAHCFPTPTEPTSLIPATGSYFMEQMEETKDEFNAFLEANTATLHHSTVYALLKSHNRHEEYIYFATLVCDYDVVIEYWISEKQWKNALEVLNKQVKKKERGRAGCTTFFF
jgi:hypothetical protein